MFNKKSFLIILIFLFLVSVFNLFNEVTFDYVGISLNLYKEFEISCGSVVEIISNIGNDAYLKSLGVNKNSVSELHLLNYLILLVLRFF